MNQSNEQNYRYQVGGSLSFRHPSYVVRVADTQLLEALKAGEFCYVLNSRQMGKSSLRVRTMQQLKAENFACTAIDLTRLGSEEVTPKQWYKGIISELERGFRLFGKVDKSWWQEYADLSPLQALSRFVEDILLVNIPEQNIVVFIDEIDSVLSLKFGVDDFFSFIRSCYNQRAENKIYHRLTFALFGVATPFNLIRGRTRTSFNIGKAIELTGFKLAETKPLQAGLQGKADNPQGVLKEILFWTGGQPFLTQKICQFIIDNERYISGDREAEVIQDIVQAKIIQNWEFQDEPIHLRTIRSRLLYQEQKFQPKLCLYQKILKQGSVTADNSLVQQDLCLSGLVVKHDSELKVYNPIYQAVYNEHWVQQELAQLRPYADAIVAWENSGKQDDSRLLRGQALKEALDWAKNKSLAPQDYQFISASQQFTRQEREIYWQAERGKRQRYWLKLLSSALVIAIALGITALFQYRKAVRNEIKAIVVSAEALLASHQQLEGLVTAIKGQKRIHQVGWIENETQSKISQVLQLGIYKIQEKNRLSGHQDWVYNVAISPNGEWFASGSADKTIKLWRKDGTLINTLQGHQGKVSKVFISPDGEWLASASTDKTIKLWRKDGTLINTLKGHQGRVYSVAISPNSQWLASASADKTIKLWQKDGTLINTLTGHEDEVRDIAISQDGNLIVSGSQDKTIKLWNREGKALQTLVGHHGTIYSVTISPDSNWIVSGSADKTVKIWHKNGILRQTLAGHQGRVWDVIISPDEEWIASASWDNTIKIWQNKQPLVSTLEGHKDVVIGVDINLQGTKIASASDDKTAIVWQPLEEVMVMLNNPQSEIYNVSISSEQNSIVWASKNHQINLWNAQENLLKNFLGHTDEVWGVSISPDGRLIASGSKDKTVKLWDYQGTLLKTFTGHTDAVWDVDISTDASLIASASADRSIRLWNLNGTLHKILQGHDDRVWGVDISPDGNFIASASTDKTVKLWQKDGQLLQTFSGHQSAVKDVALSLDAHLIASASDDNTIKLWNQEGEELKSLGGHQGTVWGIAMSADGNILVSGSEDKKVMVWNLEKILSLNELEYACDWVQDYLQTNSEVEESDRYLCDD